MPKIFISYRREDSKHAVGRLHAALSRHVKDPKRDLFIDIDNIPRGVDFVDHLDGQVAQCDVMLAVIGPAWLTATDPATNRCRLDDPNDFVRIEVASALKRGIPVVPVVLDDTRIPAPESLPEDLRALSRRNGERLEHESFDADVARLINGLPSAPKAKPAAALSRNERPAARGAGWGAPAVVLAVLALAGGGAWAWFANPGDWRMSGVRTAEGATPTSVIPDSAVAPSAGLTTETASKPDPAAEARAKADAEGRDLAQRDEAAWGVAKDADTRGPLDAYLRDFPKGAHAAEARSHIAALTRPVASPPPPIAPDVSRPVLSAEVNDALLTLDAARIADILKRGWNPNATLDTEGSAALHTLMLVCERNPTHDKAAVLRIAQALVAAGANVNQPNKWQDTPLTIARSPRYCGPDHPVTLYLQQLARS